MLFSQNCSRTHIIQKVQHFIIMYLNLKLINGALFLTSKKNLECLHKMEFDFCTTGYTFSYCGLNDPKKVVLETECLKCSSRSSIVGVRRKNPTSSVLSNLLPKL